MLSSAKMDTSLHEMKSLCHHEPPPIGFMRVTLVGAGPPKGVPALGHFDERGCVCAEVLANPCSRNARLSSSLLITFQPLFCASMTNGLEADKTGSEDEEKARHVETMPIATGEKQKASHNSFTSLLYNTLHGRRVHHVLVDCGKMFRDAYFHVLRYENLRCLNGLFLTSSSPSSLGGLDDLRDLQSMSCELGVGEWCVHHFIPTYVLPETLQALRTKVSYILQNSLIMGPCPSSEAEYISGWTEMKEKREKENAPKEWNNIGIRRSTSLQIYTIPSSLPRTVQENHAAASSGSGKEPASGVDGVPARIYVDAFGPNVPVYSLPIIRGGEGEEQHTPSPTTTGCTPSSSFSSSFGLAFGRGIRLKSNHRGWRSPCDVPVSPPSSLLAALATTNASSGEAEGSCVVYLPYLGSGVSEGTAAFLDSLEQIDLLIVECLHGPSKEALREASEGKCTSGADKEDSPRGGEDAEIEKLLMVVRRWRPLQVITTGMSCSIRVKENGVKVQKHQKGRASQTGDDLCEWLRWKLTEGLQGKEGKGNQNTEGYTPVVSMGYDGLSVVLPL